ncbi:MAG TPA: nitrate reductase molybdenum cofactor assembly chaperone [Stellaceae bacterium]|nr:nitrate reductase molybdenum cofactor assembly chaperone [Stellaceae bacterium]
MAGDPGMIVLRALGALLAYPGPALREALPEIAEAVRGSALIGAPERAAVLGLIELIAAADPLWAEERYVGLFDRGRATSLHLFEHVHGDARDRGEAMVELKSVYARAGFALTAKELPDFLPVVLEYLSCRDMAEASDMLGDCAHILRAVGEALIRRGSPYSAVFEALLRMIGEKGLDAKAAALAADEREDLDRDWREEPAFAPGGPRETR